MNCLRSIGDALDEIDAFAESLINELPRTEQFEQREEKKSEGENGITPLEDASAPQSGAVALAGVMSRDGHRSVRMASALFWLKQVQAALLGGAATGPLRRRLFDQEVGNPDRQEVRGCAVRSWKTDLAHHPRHRPSPEVLAADQ